ncbi:UDP-glucuronic acid decarboxylase 1 [Serendipita sp. 399]|nr:UDP-glucuronic acid decarboxylase 1 [Serendipita sp. 399]
MDRTGKPPRTVGIDRFGFDSTVNVKELRALYLRPRHLPSRSQALTEQNPSLSDFHSTYDSSTNNISYTTVSRFPPVKLLTPHRKKRILVTGGAGFVGSHLVDRLMLLGHDVIVIDNFFTGSKTTVSHWIGHPNFELLRHDVTEPLNIECDQIYHLACPASPPHYQFDAIKTLKTSFMGTLNMLGLAKRTKARFLITSTSEIYGDPQVHPQPEDYWGNVNPIGIRACYDEGKRVAETLTYSYQRQENVEVRVARIFNTFGPRMNPQDGRVVSNFVMQALKGENMTVYGDGKQTRSFQYIHDLIDGLIALMNSNESRPVNLGNTDEFTVGEFAEMVREVVKEVKERDGEAMAPVEIVHKPIPSDDPQRRRPDNSRAKEVLDWCPRWTVRMGVEEMTRYYKILLEAGEIE